MYLWPEHARLPFFGCLNRHFWALSFVSKEFAFEGGGLFYGYLLGNERDWVGGDTGGVEGGGFGDVSTNLVVIGL